MQTITDQINVTKKKTHNICLEIRIEVDVGVWLNFEFSLNLELVTARVFLYK